MTRWEFETLLREAGLTALYGPRSADALSDEVDAALDLEQRLAAARACSLDATVLGDFASTGSTGWLVDLLERPAVVPAVRDELVAGRQFSHEFLRHGVEAIDTVFDSSNDPEATTPTRSATDSIPANPIRSVRQSRVAAYLRRTVRQPARSLVAEGWT